MTDTIGSGVLKTVVDNSGMAPGIAQGVASLKKFEDAASKTGAAVEGALSGAAGASDALGASTTKLDATTKRFLSSLAREGEQAGRTRSEFLELRAAKLGVSDAAERYISRIKAEEQATEALRAKTKAATDAARKLLEAQSAPAANGLSRKANNAALRNVPAQFTDIVVSLQGGQNPLTVVLQQGGQLKDMFNGAGNAAKALLGYVSSLVTPFTAVAAAAALVGLAYYQGSSEINAYNKSILLSGNYSGQTAGQLGDLAAGFRQVGVTQGAAAETLAAVVETGRIAAGELGLVTQATINLTKVGGKDMSAAIQNFVALGDDPVKASQKLNESYNYLTQAVYEQIKALQENGREDEAAALAQRTFASAINDRAAQVVASLGYIEGAYNSIMKSAKMAWDSMLDVGRETTMEDKLVEQRQLVARMSLPGATGRKGFNLTATYSAADISREGATLAAMEGAAAQKQAAAEQQAQYAKDNKQAIAATDAVAKLQAQAKGVSAVTEELKKYQAQLDAIRKVNPDSELLSADNIAKGEAAIKKAHQAPKTPTKPFQDDAGTKYLQTLREQGAALDAQMESESKLNGAQKERAKFEQLISDLKTKGTLTADQKSLLANESALRTQLMKNEATASEVAAANALAKAAKEKEAAEARAYETFINRIKNNALGMVNKQEGRTDEYSRNVDAFGMSDEARKQVEAQKAIYKEYQSYKLELDKATPGNKIGSAEYQAAVAEIKARLSDALQAHQDYYATINKLEGDGAIGRTRAIENYATEAAKTADHVGQVWTNGMNTAADALVNFAKTGKLSVSSLVDSVLTDILRLEARSAISSLAGASIGSGGLSGLGSVVGSFFGFADGAVFNSPSLSAYSSGVYTSPQPFKFADGAGVFAEAGPEAIMPLKRGANGQLGVQVSGGSSAGVVVNIIESPGNGGQQTQRSENGMSIIDVFVERVKTSIATDIGRGSGAVPQALSTTYGLNRAAGVY